MCNSAHIREIAWTLAPLCGWKYFSAGILNRQSRAERQNTFDWLHILPVRVTISQYKSYSANGSHILTVEVIFCQ